MRTSVLRTRRFAVPLAVATLVLFVGSGLASADTTPAGAASYDGHVIYLSQGWQTAHACAVLSASDIECFDTRAELAAALSLPAAPTLSPDSCTSGGLELYQNANYGGNELVINGPDGIWVNLNDFGFGDETSSWINTFSCDAFAAKSTDGSGSHLTMAGGGASSYVGSAWNDAINSATVG